MGLKKFHLIGQDAATLQIDILGVCRHERNGQQLYARLFRGAAGLVVIAPLAGRHHIVPCIQPALTQGSDMIA